MRFIKIVRTVYIAIVFLTGICRSQFLDTFSRGKIVGWFFFTGDGKAKMDFIQQNGYASIFVDASEDRYNVYWTLIKRDVTASLDMKKFSDHNFQLRVEAKVRVHNAPRRVNMMVNTQRTTNFHIDLMEFDIPDTTNWHVISMTTKNFDAVPGDTVYVQLCVTDYGPGKYYVDLDYYRADIVDVRNAGPDKGELVPYHPPLPATGAFTNHLAVTHDCVINSDFPEVNFNDLYIMGKEKESRVLTVNGNQWAVLRWDLQKFRGMKADRSGLLELTTYSVTKGGDYIAAYGRDFGEEFGKVRIIEIIGGDPEWDQKDVNYNSLLRGKGLYDVFNSQMMYDLDVAGEPGAKNFVTISKPVLNRLLEGRTKGLLIRPLGAIDVSFVASEDGSGNGPKLHFNAGK
jgi:hypothetical protein